MSECSNSCGVGQQVRAPLLPGDENMVQGVVLCLRAGRIYVSFPSFDSRMARWCNADEVICTGVTEPDFKAPEISDIKNIEQIVFSNWLIKAWYYSPYPQPYNQLKTLFVCDRCMRYGTIQQGVRHIAKCEAAPPGTKIYEDSKVCFYELDGRTEKLFCQFLCLFTRLFLDSKSLYYNTDWFLFYIMVLKQPYRASGRQHEGDIRETIVGYFSKEKLEKNMLSCILTFPNHMQEGLGFYLIDFAYMLAKVENRVAGPEEPLSDLGERSFLKYWKFRLIECIVDRATRFYRTTPLVSPKRNAGQENTSPSQRGRQSEVFFVDLKDIAIELCIALKHILLAADDIAFRIRRNNEGHKTRFARYAPPELQMFIVGAIPSNVLRSKGLISEEEYKEYIDGALVEMQCMHPQTKYEKIFRQCFQKERGRLEIRFRNINRLIEYTNFNSGVTTRVCFLFQQKALKANRKRELEKLRAISEAFHIYVNTVSTLLRAESISILEATLLSLETLEHSEELLTFVATKVAAQDDIYSLYVRIYQEIKVYDGNKQEYLQYLYEICLLLEPKLIEHEIDVLVFVHALLLSHPPKEPLIGWLNVVVERFIIIFEEKLEFETVGLIPEILETFIATASGVIDWKETYVGVVDESCFNISRSMGEAAISSTIVEKVEEEAKEHALAIFDELMPRFTIYGFLEMYKSLSSLVLIHNEIGTRIIGQFSEASYVVQIQIVQTIPEELIIGRQINLEKQLFRHLADSPHGIEFLLILIQKCIMADGKRVLEPIIVELIRYTLQLHTHEKRTSRLFKAVMTLSKVGIFTSNIQQFIKSLQPQNDEMSSVADVVAPYEPTSIFDVLLLFVRLFPLFGYNDDPETCKMIEHLLPEDQKVFPQMEEILMRLEQRQNVSENQEEQWWLLLEDNFIY